MAGPVTITCPTCGRAFPVPTEILGVDESTNHVVVRMDRTELYGHLQQCVAEQPAATTPLEDAMRRHPAGKALERPWRHNDMHQPIGENGPSKAELAGRMEVMLSSGAYVAKGGSRACTMCGIKGDECLRRTKRSLKACCPPCQDGNTHPAPGESVDCQVWGAQHGAQN